MPVPSGGATGQAVNLGCPHPRLAFSIPGARNLPWIDLRRALPLAPGHDALLLQMRQSQSSPELCQRRAMERDAAAGEQAGPLLAGESQVSCCGGGWGGAPLSLAKPTLQDHCFGLPILASVALELLKVGDRRARRWTVLPLRRGTEAQLPRGLWVA